MKILATGDIHGDTGLVKKLADRAEAENVDLVVLCGDLVKDEENTANILGPFVEKQKKVLMVPGNHESVATVDFLAQVYGQTNLHGYSIKCGDVGFFGCSGNNIGIHQIDDDETFKLLAQGNDYLKGVKKKIMVTHVHPSGTKMEKFSDMVPGNNAISKAIEKFKPDIVFCSHVHEAQGIEETIGKTTIINVGTVGKIIDI